jgi:hypothetical protein
VNWHIILLPVRTPPPAAIFALAIVVLAAAACREAPKSDPATDPLLSAYSTTDTTGRVPLGGVDVWAYCQSIGYPAVGYRRGFIKGTQAAHDNWVCQKGSDQLKPVDPKPVDMADACKWAFKRSDVTGRPSDPDHAWSWNCYVAGPGSNGVPSR